MYDGSFRYEVCLDENVHWVLVALGAGNRMHHEEYAKQILTEYADVALNRANKELKETTDDN